MAQVQHLADEKFLIRECTHDDIAELQEVWYNSFNAPVFRYLFPKNPAHRAWWHEVWRVGLDSPMDRTFVVEDTTQANRIVAFSRWIVPQQDGNLEKPWPDLDEKLADMEVAGPFFEGMDKSREALMGKRPHWMLELLGTDQCYQGMGIAAALIKWGTDRADKEGLETYLDASERGKPYYVKHFDFEVKYDILIPDRPEYGSFVGKGLARQPQKA